MKFVSAKSAVANRGAAPDAFLIELAVWAASASDDIFAKNRANNDIYVHVAPQLGPFTTINHRRAVMCEVLRVLAGYESSWKWGEGVDKSNPASDTPEEFEAGPWQVSYDSRNFGPELKRLIIEKLGKDSPVAFQRGMKTDHEFAMEYTSRLLRRTINHHGPLIRGEVNRSLKREAVAEFEAIINQLQKQSRTP